MTTIQVVSVQHPHGRPHRHVRVFGYRVEDANYRTVEVCVSVEDATEIITLSRMTRAFPEIEVPDTAWIKCLGTGDLKLILAGDVSGGPA